MCGNIVADYYKIIWLEEKRYFHEIIFLDYIFKFLHGYCICSRLSCRFWNNQYVQRTKKSDLGLCLYSI